MFERLLKAKVDVSPKIYQEFLGKLHVSKIQTVDPQSWPIELVSFHQKENN